MGGKPKTSTPADKRLAVNKNKTTAPATPAKPAAKKPFPGASTPFKKQGS